MPQNISDSLRRKIAEKKWMHSFELLPGVVTPGQWGYVDSGKMFDEIYALPKNMSGLSVLDIGTLDGVHAFEAERRGATVTAMDIQSPDVTGFNLASEVIGSKVQYVQGSCYDLGALQGKFDIILFFGVWYHLKNPVRAFEQVASALSPDGILCAEGECLKEYVELDGAGQEGDVRDLARAMGQSRLPLSIYYAGPYKGDPWNWYVPNFACVNAWLETAGLEMLSSAWWDSHPHQRLHLTARFNPAIKTTVDNPVW